MTRSLWSDLWQEQQPRHSKSSDDHRQLTQRRVSAVEAAITAHLPWHIHHDWRMTRHSPQPPWHSTLSLDSLVQYTHGMMHS